MYPVSLYSGRELECVIGSDEELVAFYKNAIKDGTRLLFIFWNYTLTDLYGDVVSDNFLIERLIDLGFRKEKPRYHSIIHIRKYRRKRCLGYRHPVTAGVNRDMDFFRGENRHTREEYGVRVKGRVRKSPDVYNDIVRNSERSWKRQRQTQYR